MCRKGVGLNSILCTSCRHWVHKACTNKNRLTEDPNFKCRRCLGLIPIESTPNPDRIELEDENLEVVTSFCYLGDVIGERGGCYDATTARVRSAWKKFRELLPILTCRGISIRSRGHFYNSCVRSVLLHASETWPITTEDKARLSGWDHAIIRWICASKPFDSNPIL